MTAFPGREAFVGYLQKPWQLAWAEGSLAVELVDVNEGIAMNARHECFDLVFALPSGCQLPQHTYDLHAPDGWHLPGLLMTPIGPAEDGERQLLQAVFHVRRATPNP
ncbi:MULTISPECIES: DUF6916 family protein [Pseudomonas]|uniref:DUF6916 domain-containing protein n=1 Tax=Pseudomonas putida TaxID=303 RepID=A0A1B2F313_PSEPU|nr:MULTISPECIES: hypothetical protein [Pseudomonas]ANY86632.1 hypothetical protein IEC33019_1061 [Pseudomonas putida]MCL8308525.1 hypothetical protein [Pseudomonas putida]